jgi:predicted glycogen debranching enzyme
MSRGTTEAHPYQPGWQRGEPLDGLITREWLVTNGLGGYASGTVGGVCTRRFHGFLIAALPAPLARTMMFNHLEETLRLPDGRLWHLSGEESASGGDISYPEPDFLERFGLECGTPVWSFEKEGIRLEKRVVMPHLQNTTYVVYRLLEGPPGLHLELCPALHFRPHEGLLGGEVAKEWKIERNDGALELSDGRDYPPLRIVPFGQNAQLVEEVRHVEHILYRVEKSRGYEHEGLLWSPGWLKIDLVPGEDAGLIASVEPWEVIRALSPAEAFAAEHARRTQLLTIASSCARDDFGAQLVLAADQFLIHPHTRVADETRARAAGESPRTVIAGYHWFTDWGRDTMISLEGLTLVTGRRREAGRILRTFASYIRDGLIPNMFPEGECEGLYHTADATLWFFHALHRYVASTGDRETMRVILPKLVDSIDHHLAGTRFNIRVDPRDGLLSQGEEGYQLTWMDAKVDGWVVTPRRGKAVEINALYYNALCVLEKFLREEGDTATADRMRGHAARAYASFTERFWFAEGQYLYDVVDTPEGIDDPALRPNQIFAFSLDHPVLDPSRWSRVTEVVRAELLTPFGLRSLARNHPDYKKAYDGDLRARDAAYHQGTVWSWLIGPFIDAWLKAHPGDNGTALRFLAPFREHLGAACIGTVSEVFDAESPWVPRGCAAQAWGVAEVLRCLAMLCPAEETASDEEREAKTLTGAASGAASATASAPSPSSPSP